MKLLRLNGELISEGKTIREIAEANKANLFGAKLCGAMLCGCNIEGCIIDGYTCGLPNGTPRKEGAK